VTLSLLLKSSLDNNGKYIVTLSLLLKSSLDNNVELVISIGISQKECSGCENEAKLFLISGSDS
jgi:hypothetical protein